MSEWRLKTPVVFIIFNRPDTTEKVFELIRQVKPSKLLVIADGERTNKPGEAEKCAAVRAIIDRVDWNCEVLKNYADTNLSCQTRVSSGLNWVFDIVEEAIILEDDCLPHPTFFRFCDELLEKYRDDRRIMAIAGVNYQFGRRRTEDSYYFSRYNHCWGWATWRRAWQYYDFEMKLWSKIRNEGWLTDLLSDFYGVKYWAKIFDRTYEGKVNSWAYRWTFSCWTQSGLSILPNINLISNIGFTSEATHTNRRNKLADLPVEPMNFPLKHPLFMIRDSRADDFTQNNVFSLGLLTRIREKARKILMGE